MPCIHARKDELLEISRRFPKEIERLARWENLVAEASKRSGATFFSGNLGHKPTTEEAVAAFSIHRMVEWAKTSRGGTQYDFLRTMNDGPACSSVYGLCE
jgi:hypothetical protein